jgi:hypothetical protein
VLAAAAAAAHLRLLLDCARQNFVTLDEAAHIASGLEQWGAGDFGAYRVNPPLARMIATWPVLFLQPRLPARLGSAPAWYRSEFAMGDHFATANAGSYREIVFLARLAGIGWSLLGCWLIHRWVRTTYGNSAGLFALCLWCFSPDVLAHASLVTPDIPATVAGLGATYAFWSYLDRPNTARATVAGIVLGIAELTKFTLLLLYAIWPLLYLVHRRGLPAKARPTGMATLCHALVIGALSGLVINAGYGFQGTLQPLGQIPFISRALSGQVTAGEPGNRFAGTILARLPVPLPADYVRGIDVQRVDFESGHRLSYLGGEWRFPGWWYWYLYALAVKLPLGFIALVLASVAASFWGSRHPTGGPVDTASLLAAFAVLCFVSSQSGYTNHVRYVLPMLPFLIIVTAKLACPDIARGRKMRTVAWCLAALAAASSLRVHPHELSHFNELAGGPANGSEHLIDSNIDWGQDLLFLKTWLDEHPAARPLYLAYFNIVDPQIAGVQFELPPFTERRHCMPPAPDDGGPPLPPGYYAISVNYLRDHRLVAAHNGHGRRVPVPPNAFAYLRRLEPIGRAGYSILIFHIPPDGG